MTSPETRTYFWDFFGPRSQPTAAHFQRHLEAFLAEHGVGPLAVRLESPAPGHHAVGLVTPEPHWELIEKALRPKRHAPSRLENT
jgi:hypothetical protein